MAETKVLLVEHDTMILAFIRSVLDLHGYRVLPARNGADALRIAGGSGWDRIDLLLADVDLPTLGGAGFVRYARQLRPNLKLLCMTERPSRLAGDLGFGCPALEKPFAYTTLLNAVAESLAEAKSLRAAC